MDVQDKAILKSLVAVAWADGKVTAQEQEMLDALISAFDANAEEAAEIREFAAMQRTLEDVPLTDLSADDRRTLLNHAVVLTHIDGQQAIQERQLIQRLADRLRIGDDEARGIVEAAEARAKRLLELL